MPNINPIFVEQAVQAVGPKVRRHRRGVTNSLFSAMVFRMMVTRETLYDEVWAEPMLQVAARYKVSSSLMARICRRMRVPCPPRGYWAKRNAGLNPRVPKLPEAQPGDDLTWGRGEQGIRMPPRAPKVGARPTATQLTPPTSASGRHRHLEGIEEFFKSSGATRSGHLKPSKRLMADLFVSKDILERAIGTANAFYLALHAAGHGVGFSPTGAYHPRPDIQPCQGKTGEVSSWDTWHPSRPTVAWFGTMAIGLTIYEVSEEVEAKHVNGKYVRLSEVPVPKRKPLYEPYSWTAKHEFLLGRLAIRAFSPYQGVSWERHWIEAEAGGLPGMFDEIVRSLKRHASLLVPKVREAMGTRCRQAEEAVKAREEWERKRAIELEAQKRDAEDKARTKACVDSKGDILQIIRAWGQAKQVLAFMTEAEEAISKLEEPERSALRERLRLAAEFMRGPDAIQLLKGWQTPEERYVAPKWSWHRWE